MTVTVKLEALLERRLRHCAAASGRSASDVIRAALVDYLARPEMAPVVSAHALGADLFGRHAGPADLATKRKAEVSDVWSERADARQAGPSGRS